MALEGVYTSFDSIPLLRSLVRNYATSQERQQEQRADREAEEKVAGKAIGRLNSDANPRLAEAQEKFQRNWLGPLQKLALDPTALAMRTTDVRLLLRGRLT